MWLAWPEPPSWQPTAATWRPFAVFGVFLAVASVLAPTASSAASAAAAAPNAITLFIPLPRSEFRGDPMAAEDVRSTPSLSVRLGALQIDYGRTNPMRSYMASSVGSEAARALSAPTASSR